jgi:hypothetical protein
MISILRSIVSQKRNRNSGCSGSRYELLGIWALG